VFIDGKCVKDQESQCIMDGNASRIFNEICVDRVRANNRPQGCLNSKGYDNLRSYSRVQIKNCWYALKGDYTIWKTLLLHASVLGRDQKNGSISASNEWWEDKIAVCTLILYLI
jgi:hypothetical protein